MAEEPHSGGSGKQGAALHGMGMSPISAQRAPLRHPVRNGELGTLHGHRANDCQRLCVSFDVGDGSSNLHNGILHRLDAHNHLATSSGTRTLEGRWGRLSQKKLSTRM